MDDLGNKIPGMVRDMVMALAGTGLAASWMTNEMWVGVASVAAGLAGMVYTFLHRKAVAQAEAVKK